MQIFDFDNDKKPKIKNIPTRPTQKQPTNSQPQVTHPAPVTNPPRPHSGKKIVLTVFLLLIALVIIAAGLIIWKVNAIGGKIFGRRTSFFEQATNLVTKNPAAAELIGQAQGQVNVMLLGYGGSGHDGPYLTDSMMLMSIRPQDKNIILTSIPRDYYYPTAQGDKINAVFPSVFSSSNPTSQDIENGGTAVETAIGNLSGLSIPYFAAIDFQGFIDAVNTVGGLDITVPDAFTDNQYPNGDSKDNGPVCVAPVGDTASPCRYRAIHFDAGEQHMDGETALEFTRSRHAAGPEGSDFARSNRQHLVLEAFKNKVQLLNLFADAGTINNLLNILADHLHTNLTLAQAQTLLQIAKQPGMQIASQSLDPSTNLVCNGVLPTDGADIVEPCSGITADMLSAFFQNGYKYTAVRSEQATVILENYNASSSTYASLKQSLVNAGATVYDAVYHSTPLTQSVIYTVDSSTPATLEFLEQQLKVTAQPLPPGLKAKSDLVVVVAGQ